MQPRARTFKALATLALSMIGGTLLLAWLEPLPPAADGNTTHQNPLLTRRQAREAVGNRFVESMPPWAGIEVLALHQDQPSANLLTARAPRKDLHFLVGLNGQLQPLPAWQRQDLRLNDGMIRIGLAASGEGKHIPRAQWEALRALLAALEARIDSGEALLPVRMTPARDARAT
ncbi:MAG: hypothetical protein ACE5GE_09165, partial [Phycisphaerae bacterium]